MRIFAKLTGKECATCVALGAALGIVGAAYFWQTPASKRVALQAAQAADQCGLTDRALAEIAGRAVSEWPDCIATYPGPDISMWPESVSRNSGSVFGTMPER